MVVTVSDAFTAKGLITLLLRVSPVAYCPVPPYNIKNPTPYAFWAESPLRTNRALSSQYALSTILVSICTPSASSINIGITILPMMYSIESNADQSPKLRCSSFLTNQYSTTKVSTLPTTCVGSYWNTSVLRLGLIVSIATKDTRPPGVRLYTFMTAVESL